MSGGKMKKEDTKGLEEKKQYEPPRIVEEEEFENFALGCGKLNGSGMPKCVAIGGDS